MITYFQAIILGLLQGVSELFPISSLGHSVIFPALFGWNIHENDDFFLTFLVATHLATALVLLGFYWKSWLRIISGIFSSLRDREIKTTNAQLGWLLVIGTIPAGIIGLLFQDQIREHFITATSAAIFLFFNGLLLLGAERLRRRAPVEAGNTEANIARLGWVKSLGVGVSQSLALIPGFSRSGATMAGGLVAGLSNEDAVEFAFLLATPIILAAAVLKLPSLLSSSYHALLGPAIVGAVCAAISAYAAVRFLTRYIKTNTLTPFGIYCVIAGAGTSLYFWLR